MPLYIGMMAEKDILQIILFPGHTYRLEALQNQCMIPGKRLKYVSKLP